MAAWRATVAASASGRTAPGSAARSAIPTTMPGLRRRRHWLRPTRRPTPLRAASRSHREPAGSATRHRHHRSSTITDDRQRADAERKAANLGTRRLLCRFPTSSGNRLPALQLCRYGANVMRKTLSTMATAAILVAGTSSLALAQYYSSQPTYGYQPGYAAPSYAPGY